MDLTPGYREQAPPVALRPAVTCVWARIVPRSEGAEVLVLPDGCCDLIWAQGRGVFVAGPDTGPAPEETAPGAVLVGVRFAPGAGGPALGLPLSELRDQRIDAADLGSGPGTLLARVPGGLPPREALRTLVTLAGDMVAGSAADHAVTAGARLLARPGAEAAGVAATLGLSDRQFRRRCQAAAGYGPATLRRVLRFRRFLSWVDAGGGDLAQAAADFGYADQAHLTRETVSLAGLTPTALARARRYDSMNL